MTKMSGAHALARQLEREGVRDLFAIPGVQMDPATDALLDVAVRYRLPRHEQATSYMADGYARAGGRPGVCMIVPGPGLLNAMAGLATAYACNSRVLCIAGQIHSTLIGAGRGLLHEVRAQDAILGSVTQWSACARHAGEIPRLVNEAFTRLAGVRPRPVGLEIPPDVLEQHAEIELLAPARAVAAPLPPASEIERVAESLRSARLPVIWAGGGALAARAGAALQQLSSRLGAPVIVSTNGRSVLPSGEPLVLPALAGRVLLPRADLVLVVGSRFLDGLGNPVHAGDATRFVYVNADAADTGAPRREGIALAGDAARVTQAIADALGAGAPVDAVLDQRLALARKVRAWCDDQIAQLEPQLEYVRALRAAMPDDAIFVTEMTQVGYAANLAFEVRAPGTYLGPGYQGTLGFGFPTALGAAVACPQRFVVSINGDGGFGWNLQELATAARFGVDLAIVVFNDGAFGNVRRIQHSRFGREIAVTLHNPDFVALARAFGVHGERVEGAAAMQAAIERARARGGPSLIEVPVGEMPGPWHLIHAHAKPPRPAPPDPLA